MKLPTMKMAVLASALVSVLLLGAMGCSDDGGDDASSDTTAEAAKPATSEPPADEEPDEEEVEVFDPDGAGMADAEEDQDEFAGEFMGEVEDETEELDDSGSYAGYVELGDDTGALIIEVPEEFTDVSTTTNSDGLPQIDASTDLDGYVNTWGVSGVTYNSFGSDTTGFTSSQEAFDNQEGVVSDNCTLDSSESFTEDNLDYTVGYYLDCAGTDTDYGLAYIFLGSDLPILSIQYQLTSVADGEAFENALATFDYSINNLPTT